MIVISGFLAFVSKNPICFSDGSMSNDVADTKVMSEFLHRDGDRYWTTIDGVRQLYRRIECKMCFEVIEKLRGL